jgi:RHS repeat-associated protein
LKNPFTYKGAYGYYYDEETGLYYLKARYYGPKIYRFISRDPIEKAPELVDLQNPLSLNPYLYCEDDPVNKVDPDGTWTKCLYIGFGSYIKIKYLGKVKYRGHRRYKFRIYFKLTYGDLLVIGISALANRYYWWALRALGWIPYSVKRRIGWIGLGWLMRYGYSIILKYGLQKKYKSLYKTIIYRKGTFYIGATYYR